MSPSGSSWLWQITKHSLFLMIYGCWGLMVRLFVECLYWFIWCFFSLLTWSNVSFGEEDQRSKVSFSSYDIKGTCYQQLMLNVPPGWGRAVRVLKDKDALFHPLLYFIPFEKESTRHSPHLGIGILSFIDFGAQEIYLFIQIIYFLFILYQCWFAGSSLKD